MQKHQYGFVMHGNTGEFKFGYVDMEYKANPIVWDSIPKDDFNLIMQAKNLYEQCIAYSGRNVHEVNGAAGNLLNGAVNFLLSFTENFISKRFDISSLDEDCKDDGGWKCHTRKFLVDQAIPRALKALML